MTNLVLQTVGPDLHEVVHTGTGRVIAFGPNKALLLSYMRDVDGPTPQETKPARRMVRRPRGGSA